MRLTYQIVVDVDPGEKFDPLAFRDAMAAAVDQFKAEGELTPTDDVDTGITRIVFSLVNIVHSEIK